MTLTEQLYEGTLPTGWYYFNNGHESYIVKYDNINTKHWKLQEPEGLKVLAKVPSYEELEEAYGCILHSEVLRLKNIQLKKWLEEFNLLNAVQDCKALAKLVLKLSPERKEWLEKHYGEYL
jgi:hypothetical protein